VVVGGGVEQGKLCARVLRLEGSPAGTGCSVLQGCTWQPPSQRPCNLCQQCDDSVGSVWHLAT